MYRLEQQDFSNHHALHKNRLPARAYFLPYEGREAALKGQSSRIESLSGTWQFRYVDNALLADQQAVAEPADSAHGYENMAVPMSWQYAGFGPFLYTDEAYPFPVDPPFIPSNNPTGIYKRGISWDGQDQLILRLEGVESFCRAYLNDHEVGFTKGSRMPSEFDLTPYAHKGDNRLCLVVHQYCDGSYLEDQDMWWLGGIIRDVLLLKRPEAKLNDLVLDVDYNATTQQGSLKVSAPASQQADSVTLELLNQAGQVVASAQASDGKAVLTVDKALPWNAEQPNLYTLLVSVRQGDEVTECIRQQVGFRRVEIKDGQLLVNGQRVMLRGVNRHEYCPEKGRAISYERTRKDLLLMKQHHINALRTAHYPNNPFVYELCNELGLYVMDECDLELHGFLIEGDPRRLMEDNSWQPAFLDRAERMVARDRNQPCIIMWSLGNESHSGKNVFAMYDHIKAMDSSRPIHYEGDMDFQGRMDVTSTMYSTIGLLAEMDGMAVNKPHILCEFAHAMGNGPGSFEEYVDTMENSRRIQGYFVWEWRDHGVKTVDENGTVYYRYGGEFGEKDTSGNFCMDGLLAADSTPTPGFYAYAKAIEPLKVTGTDKKAWQVKNRFDFRDIQDVKVTWTLMRDGQVVQELTEDFPVIPPHETASLKVPQQLQDHVMDNALWTLEARMNDHHTLLGQHQAVLASYQPQAINVSGLPEMTDLPALIRVTGPHFSMHISKMDGRIKDYTVDGKTLLHQGPALDFFRAYIDNDRILRRDWEKLSLHNMETVLKSLEVQERENHLLVKAHLSLGAIARTWRAPHTVVYRIFADGRVLMDIQGEFAGPFGESPRDEVPRIGTTSKLPGRLQQVSYLAAGPGESYCDSKAQAPLNIYHPTVNEMNFPYECPQEQGNRTDCNFAVLKDGEGAGLAFVSLTGRDMSCKTCDDYDLLLARHAKDVPVRDEITVHFDQLNSGLGSASCGPGHLRPYMAKAIHFDFGFALAPVHKEPVNTAYQAMDLLHTYGKKENR